MTTTIGAFEMDAPARASIARHVYRYRIVIHKLGRDGTEGWDENDVTVQLLLGGMKFIHLNLTRGLPAGQAGLYVSASEHSLPTDLVTFKDIDAVGCPANFELVSTAPPSNAALRTVGEVLASIQAESWPLHHYRYISVANNWQGTRHWVYTAMSRLAVAGFTRLPLHTFFSTGVISLDLLLQHCWDPPQRPRRVDIIPGFFCGHLVTRWAFHEAGRETGPLIRQVSPTVLGWLRLAVEARFPNIRDVDNGVDWEGLTVENIHKELDLFIEPLNEKGWELEAAMDLTRVFTLTYANQLIDALHGEFPIATARLQSASAWIGQPSQRSNMYVTLLCALIALDSGV